MSDERDLWIENGDLVFGADGEPEFLSGVVAITQDVKHRLLESLLPVNLVGDDAAPPGAIARLALVVEEDGRILPGSTRVETDAHGKIIITAKTMEGAAVETNIGG